MDKKSCLFLEIAYILLGNQAVAQFETALREEEDDEEDGVGGVRDAGGDGCSIDAVARDEREAENEGENQPAKRGVDVHLVSPDAGIVVAYKQIDAEKQHARRQNANQNAHLAELRTEEPQEERRRETTECEDGGK